MGKNLLERIDIKEDIVYLRGCVVKKIIKMYEYSPLIFVVFVDDQGKEYEIMIPISDTVLLESVDLMKDKESFVRIKIYRSSEQERYKLLGILKKEV